MFRHFGTAVRMTILSIVLLGVIYPVVMTGIAQALFPKAANGSLVVVNGKVVGSWLVGQRWTKPQYFQGRPSAAGKGYDPTSTGGTNLGPSSAKLMKATKATIAQLRQANPDASGAPPIDLVTSSASGIDPDITPEAAYWEAPRIAKARRMPLGAVRGLVAAHVQGRQFGFLGEPHVNVLELNLALDGLRPQ
ncbi:MAG TPA: potassium-transporting ATPase subunit KdpC [Candidatus Tumulicola sp.]